MAYEPNVRSSTASRELSARARDLNQRLDQAIEEFRRYYPDTTDADVRNALMAAGSAHAGGSRRIAVAFALAGLVAAAVGALVAAGSMPDLSPAFWLGAAAAVAALAAVIARRPR